MAYVVEPDLLVRQPRLRRAHRGREDEAPPRHDRLCRLPLAMLPQGIAGQQIAVSLTSSSAVGGRRLCVSEGMLRLVEPDPSAAGQSNPRDTSPTLLVEWPGDGDFSVFERLCRRLDVFAEQVELVIVLVLGRVDRKLGGGKHEDEPAAARIDRVEAEHLPEERAIRLGIVAVDQRVHARNQRLHPVSLTRLRAWPVLAWTDVTAAGRPGLSASAPYRPSVASASWSTRASWWRCSVPMVPAR